MEVPDRTIWHQQTMLNIKIGLFVDRVIESLMHVISVVRMNSLKYQLHCWLNRSILFKDVIGFLRPVNFPAENTPPKTSGVTQILRFGQVSFTASQLFFRLLRSGDIHHRPRKLNDS